MKRKYGKESEREKKKQEQKQKRQDNGGVAGNTIN